MRANSNCSQSLKKKRRVIPIQSNSSKDFNKLNNNASIQSKDQVNSSKHSSDNNREQQIQQKQHYPTHLDTSEKQKLDTLIPISRNDRSIVKDNSKQLILSELQEQIKKARSSELKFNNYRQLIQQYEKYRMKSKLIECKPSKVKRLNHYPSHQHISHYYPSIEEILRQKQHLKYTNKICTYSNNNITKNYHSLSSKTLIVNSNQADRSLQMRNHQHQKYNHKKTKYHQQQVQPYMITINQNSKSRTQGTFGQKEMKKSNSIKNTNRKRQFDVNDKNFDEDRNEQNENNFIFIENNYQQANGNHQRQMTHHQNQNKNHQHQMENFRRQKTNSQHSKSSYQHSRKQQIITGNNNSVNNKQLSPTNNDNDIIDKHKQQAYIKQLHQKYLSLNQNYNKYLKQTKQLNDQFERGKEHLLKIKTEHFKNQQLIDELMFMVRNRNYQLLQGGGDGCQGLGKLSVEVQAQGQSCEEEGKVIEELRSNDKKQVQGNNNQITIQIIPNEFSQQQPNKSITPLYSPLATQNSNSMRGLKKDLFQVKKLMAGKQSLSKYRFEPSMMI